MLGLKACATTAQLKIGNSCSVIKKKKKLKTFKAKQLGRSKSRNGAEATPHNRFHTRDLLGEGGVEGKDIRERGERGGRERAERERE